MTQQDTDTGLRGWAYGDNVCEAVVELLIRSDLAGQDEPWIRFDLSQRMHTVDFEAVSVGRPGLTSSQDAVLLPTASLTDHALIDLRTIVRDLDYDDLLLAITAITHAAGYHQTSTDAGNRHGSITRIMRRPPIMNWDDSDTYH